jgi:hypothetical protein
MGAVSDGQFLKRSGTGIIGAAAGGAQTIEDLLLFRDIGGLCPKDSNFTPETWGNMEQMVATDTSSTSSDDNEGKYFQQSTAASVGSLAQINMDLAKAAFKRIYSSIVIWRFNLVSVADVRFRVGFSSSSTPCSADDPSAHLATMRFSTTVPDTNFVFETKDGSTLATSDSGIAGDTSVHYIVGTLDNSVPNATLTLYNASGTQQATHTFTANLPGETTRLTPYCGLTAQAATAKSVNHYTAYGINRISG